MFSSSKTSGTENMVIYDCVLVGSILTTDPILGMVTLYLKDVLSEHSHFTRFVERPHRSLPQVVPSQRRIRMGSCPNFAPVQAD